MLVGHPARLKVFVERVDVRRKRVLLVTGRGFLLRSEKSHTHEFGTAFEIGQEVPCRSLVLAPGCDFASDTFTVAEASGERPACENEPLLSPHAGCDWRRSCPARSVGPARDLLSVS